MSHIINHKLCFVRGFGVKSDVCEIPSSLFGVITENTYYKNSGDFEIYAYLKVHKSVEYVDINFTTRPYGYEVSQ